jgi:hypothetical protein
MATMIYSPPVVISREYSELAKSTQKPENQSIWECNPYFSASWGHGVGWRQVENRLQENLGDILHICNCSTGMLIAKYGIGGASTWKADLWGLCNPCFQAKGMFRTEWEPCPSRWGIRCGVPQLVKSAKTQTESVSVGFELNQRFKENHLGGSREVPLTLRVTRFFFQV